MTPQLVVLGLLLLLGGLWLWLRRPDDLEQARQRERALEAMRRWTE